MANIEELTDKHAIAEVVLRMCRGIDRLDLSAVRACYHDDALDHRTGFEGGPDEYLAWLEGFMRPLAGSMHFVGNQLIEIDADVAVCETYGTSHLWGDPPEDPAKNFSTGFRWVDRMERREGVWRIAERWAVREWTRTVPADVVRAAGGAGPVGRRGGEDVVYRAWGDRDRARGDRDD